MRKEAIIFLALFVLIGVVSAAPCANRDQITSSCECNGVIRTSGYCCYYSASPTTNITYQPSQQCGYTEVSPHWSHILTFDVDYNYWNNPTQEQREDIFAVKHFDAMISNTGSKMVYNPNLGVYLYTIDQSYFSDTDLYGYYAEMQAFATANGYNIEDMFMHFSESSVVNGFNTAGPTCAYPQDTISVSGCTNATRSPACRVKICVWNLARWVIDPNSNLAKAYYAYKWNNHTTTLDANGYTYKGLFLDEHPYYIHGHSNVVSGGSVLEYGNFKFGDTQFQGLYNNYINSFLSAQNAGMPTTKNLIPNHATWAQDTVAVQQSMASDGAFFEFNLDPNTPHYAMTARFNASDYLTAAGKMVVWSTLSKKSSLPVDDYGYTYPNGYTPGSYYNNANRSRLVELSYYYLAKDVSNKLSYFNSLGAYAPQNDPAWTYNNSWNKAIETDIGTPTEHWYEYDSGTDPIGGIYYIWARNFTKALVLVRPKTGWNDSAPGFYGDPSKITVNLPTAMIPINAEGTRMPQRNTFDFRNAEAAILLYLSGPSSDVNSDGLINIKDLSIVIFNQGRTPTGNYAHLDLNSDSLINWNDVQIVMSSM